MQQAVAQRRLTAILSADVVGYSRLMQADDRATLDNLTEIRALFAQQAAVRNGRIVNAAGDAVLAEFASVVDAVQCALDVQENLARRNADRPEAQRMQMRIGVNLGDVLVNADGIYGDGVNVAARLESLCEPGGVAVSADVYEQVRDKMQVGFVDRGEHSVKNISRPVRVYSLDARGSKGIQKARSTSARRTMALIAVLIAVAASVAAAAWFKARETRPEHSARTAALGAARPFRSMAVMPFSADGSVPSQELAKALTKDLTIAAGRAIRDGYVVSSGLVEQYGSATRDPRKIGQDLNVRYVTEGSLQLIRPDYELTVTLIDTIDGSQVWSDRHKLAPDAVPGTVARLTNGLRTGMSNSLRKEVMALPEYQRAAWDIWFRASDLPLTAAGDQRREQMYEDALKIDPSFIPALRGLAWILWLRVVSEPERRDATIKRLDEVSRRAIQLGATDPRAWIWRAWALQRQGNWGGAFAAIDEALRIDPFRSDTLDARAGILIGAGRSSEALAELSRAEELDPTNTNVVIWRCLAYVLLERDREATSICEKAAGYFGHWLMYAYLTAAYANIGDRDKATAWKRKLTEANSGISVERFRQGHAISDSPVWLAQSEHIISGLRKAGLAEK